MNIGNITSDNFSLDINGLQMQIEVYEREIDRLNHAIKALKYYSYNALGIIYNLKDNVEPTESEWLNLMCFEKFLKELKGE